MDIKKKLRPYWIRLAIVVVIAIIGSGAFNEAVYQFQKEDYDRSPRVIQLVIPNGTAKLVEAGQDPPSIPAELVFVVGDMLEVKNEDVVSHQVGPIWVPPATTGSLVMNEPEKQLFSCSFQTSRYLGIDVRQPTTLGTRLTALGLVAPTTAALLFLYSLAVFPIDGKLARKEQHPSDSTGNPTLLASSTQSYPEHPLEELASSNGHGDLSEDHSRGSK